MYKSYCPWMSLSVPSAGTQNCMDWRLLVKERIANFKNNMKKITNIFFEGLENIFGLDSVWSFWLNRLVQQDPQICLGQPAYCATGEGFVAVTVAVDDR